MWNQFFLENAHFAINLLAALIFFATMWLYFDAWLARKSLKDGLKILGLLFLTFSFIVHATEIESSVLQSRLLGESLSSVIFISTRILGYLLLIVGLLIDPIQSRPKIKLENYSIIILPPFLIWDFIPAIFPVLSALVGFLYLRRATKGLENHLKPVSLCFYLLSLHELLSLSSSLSNTSNVALFNLVKPFGPLWLISHFVLLLVLIVLGRWLYYYLLKRLQAQLFIIITSLILFIFLFTTTTFTTLLLRNLENETLKRLETDVKILNYAVESKKSESLSDSQVLAKDSTVISEIEQKTKTSLSKVVESYLLTKKQNTLIIVSDTAQVLARGEDPGRVGDSLSDDPLIKRALLGESVSAISSKDGVLGPEVSVKSATPIKQGQKIIGAVLGGTILDTAFVDGIKKATNLEASIYGDNILSASTLESSDKKSRFVGIKEEGNQIKTQVLQNGKSFTGSLDLLNTPYFVAILPLKDSDNTPIGMLSVGQPQIGVLQTASQSIELTFLVVAILLMLSVIPSFLVAKYISMQLR